MVAGIGKSIFMAYFFLRYKISHRKATIILVSFTDNSAVQKVVVWKDEHASRSLNYDIRDLSAQYSEDSDAIFLLDGPPNMAPPFAKRYVVFTSPNERWFRSMRKEESHTRLYLPLWDAEELLDAVDMLQLSTVLGRLYVDAFPRDDHGRHVQEVMYRYDVFGGVARPCLSVKMEFVQLELNELKRAVDAVDIEAGAAMLKGDEPKEMRHRLYHCVPSDNLIFSTLKLASPYVTHLLCDQLEQMKDEDKERLKSAVEKTPEAAVLYGSIQERSVHRALEKGAQLDARQLVGNDEALVGNLNLEILASNRVGLLKNKFELVDLTGGPYFKPEGKTFESIDAFYLIETQDNKAKTPWGGIEVVLFQVTVSHTHPVKAKGLYAVLKQLRINDPRKAALVFAVPKDKMNIFKKQRVSGSDALHDNSPITAVSRIKFAIKSALKGTNISTVGQLRKLPPNAKFDKKQIKTYMTAQECLNRHENEVVAYDSDAYRMLEQIPQFVWGV